MTDIFLNSGAVGLADGTNWDNAYITLSSAIAGMSAGDTLAWANNSIEVISTSTVYTFPSNCLCVCSTVSGINTITSTKATTRQLYLNVDHRDVTIDGVNSYFFGIYVASKRDVIGYDITTNSCTFVCGASQGQSTSPSINVILSDRGWTSKDDIFINEGLVASNTSLMTIGSDGRFKMIGGSISSAYTDNTGSKSIIDVAQGSVVLLDGVDCTGTQKDTFSVLDEVGSFVAKNILLHSGTVNLTSTIETAITQHIIIDNVTSGNNTEMQYRSDREGELFSDTGIVLDATNPSSLKVSNKIVTNTNANEFFAPVRFPIINGWADFSTAKTLAIEIVQDGTTTPLLDSEIWIELQYPNDTTALSHFDDDKAVDNQTTANQTTSTAAWTGLSGTNVKQKCEVITTQAGKAGPYQVFICVAKPNTTVYVNPKADII